MDVVVVGTVAYDAIETPFGKTDKILGGSGSYIGLSSSYFGLKSGIVSVIGNDFKQEYLDLFKSKHIDTEGIELKKEGKTFFWSGKYHNDMNSRDTLVTELNVLADFTPVLPESYKSPKYLLVGNLAPSVQKSVISQLENRPKLIVLDTMNFWMDNTWNELIDVLKDVDVLTINDSEARQLAGEYSLVKAAEKIRTMGPKYLIIKKGEHGALLFFENKIFSAPALPLAEVFDPTGAGDTFAGGFIGYLAKVDEVNFETMKRAVIAGSAMASFCVEKFGPERLINLKTEELTKRESEFKNLTEFTL